MGFYSFIDYALNFGLPGLIIGIVAFWFLTKKVDAEKRAKYLKISSYIFITPFILDMIIFGPTSLLSVAIYGLIGLAGLILAGLSIKEKQWLSSVLFLAPMVSTLALMIILGP
ncbi:hypothetical protein R9X47_10075 [Wukongibacter baidiensis]|uniref:hypothetical protein n=1 Tax=Wukongibacter baidiensis TaxID=1723361 RepID=UPI003D7F1FCA